MGQMATQVVALSLVLLLVFNGSVKAWKKDQRVQTQDDFPAIRYLHLHAILTSK